MSSTATKSASKPSASKPKLKKAKATKSKTPAKKPAKAKKAKAAKSKPREKTKLVALPATLGYLKKLDAALKRHGFVGTTGRPNRSAFLKKMTDALIAKPKKGA